MQSITNTQTNQLNVLTSIVRLSIIASLFMGIMLLSHQVNAQTVKIEDLILFAPGGSSSSVGTSGFVQNNNSSIQISPNPATTNSIITIKKTTSLQFTKLDVVNSQGEVIFSAPFTNGYIYDLNLDAGLYYFRVHSSVGLITKHVSIT